MRFIKLDLKKEFIMGLKSNRKVALSEQGKGRYQRIDQLDLPEGTTKLIYLEGVPFPMQLIRQVFTNGDGSTGVRYLVTSDLTVNADQIITIYQRRWKVEEYHRSLKQNVALTKSPTRTETTQTNHFVAALWSFVKIELLKVRTKKNHYQLKVSCIYLLCNRLFRNYEQLQPVSLVDVVAA
ncbi:MAG: transposase [Chloroflexota bacterium]